ncbi:MAG TPA: hypothetical protein PLA50_08200 [Bacteroidia bacterium]|nr:hypothetical protein [Bacteroidia bacterium]
MELPLRHVAAIPARFAPLLLILTVSCSTVKMRNHSGAVSREAKQTLEALHHHSDLVAQFAEDDRRLIQQARSKELLSPLEAASGYLKSAVDAYGLIVSTSAARDPQQEADLVVLHNCSLALFVELWMRDPEGEHRQFKWRDETFAIRFAEGSAYDPTYFDRAVASLCFEKKGIVQQTRDGLGASLVCVRERVPERAEELAFFTQRGINVPATLTIDAVSRFPGEGRTEVVLSLRDPLREQTVTAGGREFPLAADFSASFAQAFRNQNQDLLGLEGFFKATKRSTSSGIYLTEPYDPHRTPVLLIHGLVSVPMIWRDMIPQMMAEPDLAERYQFLVFAYPSGYPIVESAALLRDSLAEIRARYDPEGDDPLSTDLVAVGHSMGGILAHTLCVEIGDRLWQQFGIDTPLDELPIDPAKRERLREVVFFKPDPAVNRAVFFSAPHRGSYSAEKSLATLLSRTAKLPNDLLVTTGAIFEAAAETNPDLRALAKGPHTGAQSLRPGSPLLVALDESPYRTGVVYHSIIGDQGRGDSPYSTDGVVEYWSSHQEGAASELIVPTGHRSYTHPLAVAEMKRILRLHAAR